MSPHKVVDLGAVVNDEIEQQTLQEMIRFDPSPDMKNIMVTGGNGFIGSWLIRALVVTYPDCYNIVSFDKLDYGASFNNTKMLNGHPNFSFVEGDITRPEHIEACLRKYKIDTIIHLAALTNVDNSLKNPFGFTASNIHGTQVVLEVAKTCGVKKFIQMSSFEAYGASQPGPNGHHENEPLSPKNPYGAGKAAAEMLVHAFGNSTPMRTIIVRSTNIYGPNQFPDKIIPKFIMLLLRGHKLTLQGAGDGSRRYLHAADAANAFNVLLHRGLAGEVYNLGSDDEVTHQRLAETLLELVDPPGYDSSDVEAWIERKPGRPYIDSINQMDCTKLRALGWEPKVDFKEGLKRTVQWYRAYGDTWWEGAEKAVIPSA